MCRRREWATPAGDRRCTGLTSRLVEEDIVRAIVVGTGTIGTAVKKVMQEHGDAVANAAGDVFPGPLKLTTDEQWAENTVLSERAFYQLGGPGCDGLRVGCRDVFAHGQRPSEVHGPALEDEALAVHRGFWDQRT
jgi:hypothetical protein